MKRKLGVNESEGVCEKGIGAKNMLLEKKKTDTFRFVHVAHEI